MKKLVSALLVLAMVFALAGCGTPSEIVKEKELKKNNFETYFNVQVTFDSVNTNFSAYDGTDPKYEGGRWMWGTATATVTVTPVSTNKIETNGCKATIKIDCGWPFGSRNVEVTLDENGYYSGNVFFETSKGGVTKDGYTPTDYAKPVAKCEMVEASGNMKIHIKLDKNGSVITDTEE